MPQQERRVQSRSITAAAKNVSFRKSKSKADNSQLRVGEEWQRAAWGFFDIVPEFHQSCAMTGSLLSRAKLLVVERGADGTWKPTENKVAIAALRELYGGEDGQVEMLRQLGIHFSVAGGGYIVGPTNDADVMNPEKWFVAASTEMSKSGKTYRMNGKEIENVFAIELWKRHPRNPRKYDSPTRAILPVLAELVQLTKRAAAQIDSRLTGNGLFMLPSETEFPSMPVRRNPGDPETVADSVVGGDAQGLMDLIQEVAGIAIQDQAGPEATLPIFATTPGEHLGKAQHYRFWSDLDEAMPQLRQELIRRIAIGMDIPPELLLGGAESNHWNMWLSDENSVKLYAEPLLRVITSSLTSGYLRYALDGEVDDVTAFAITADTSQMRMRPNRSKEAIELYEHGELSAVTMRRENGFDESDAPTDDERQRTLLFKVAGGSTTPELVDAALKKEGVDLGIAITDIRKPAEARPDRSIADHPVRNIPEQSASAAARSLALTYAAEQMVDRALQRAGNRIKSKYGAKDSTFKANRLYLGVTIGTADLDDLLQDAWEGTESVADLVHPARLARALDLYTRSIILGRREPSRSTLASALNLLLESAAPEGDLS